MNHDWDDIKDWSLARGISLTAGYTIITLDAIGSTNEYLKQLWRDEKAQHGCLVIADTQTAGKGRLGRAWESPPGAGLWMSLLIKPSLPPDKHFAYSFAAAVAVAEAIEQTTRLRPELKWPNDVLLCQKKCCGILLESVTTGSEPWIIVGIGINVTQESFPDALSDTAISLQQAHAAPVHRLQLLQNLIPALQSNFSSDSREILIKWQSYCRMFGAMVSVFQQDSVMEAKAVGLAPDGGLVVENEGKRIKVYAADVKIRLKN